MSKQTRPGVYQHYKGGRYTVLFTALESTNGRERKPVVVYVSSTGGGTVMVAGALVLRFEPVATVRPGS